MDATDKTKEHESLLPLPTQTQEKHLTPNDKIKKFEPVNVAGYFTFFSSLVLHAATPKDPLERARHGIVIQMWSLTNMSLLIFFYVLLIRDRLALEKNDKDRRRIKRNTKLILIGFTVMYVLCGVTIWVGYDQVKKLGGHVELRQTIAQLGQTILSTWIRIPLSKMAHIAGF